MKKRAVEISAMACGILPFYAYPSRLRGGGLPIRFREERLAFVRLNRVKRINFFNALFERNGIIAAGIYADWYEAGAEASAEGECGWDFGSSSDYPALLCLPISREAQRSLYSVSLDGALHFFIE